MVENTGCSSKISQADLKRILTGLPISNDPRVLVGMPAGDDAGIFQYDGDQLAWVQTVDVFTPVVDDPYAFGQIAAANSVSDVYAMSGKPLTALSIVGYPVREAPEKALREMLRGGIEKMNEAGVAVIGGHSINDKEVKAGFAVTGLVDKNKMITNDGCQPGDVLILTKPIGTGILSFADQIDRAPQQGIQAMTHSMAALNKGAAQCMIEFAAHAGTDITGFGLMGHLSAMVRASQVTVEIVWDDIPLFPGVLQCVADGVLPGGIERNKESCAEVVHAGDNISSAMFDLCFDPQTSGGLLFAVEESKAQKCLEYLRNEGVDEPKIIGTVTENSDGCVNLVTTGSRFLPEPTQHEEIENTNIETGYSTMNKQPNDDVPCCADALEADSGSGRAPELFQNFLKSTSSAGVIDAYTKQAISIALSVLAKCEPCLKLHIKKAREKGFSQEEIDEAAWMAIAFGGSPTMMFYKDVCKNL
jgi:selenide,water dikinase